MTAPEPATGGPDPDDLASDPGAEILADAPAPRGQVGEVSWEVLAGADGRFGYRLHRGGRIVGGGSLCSTAASAARDAQRDATRLAGLPPEPASAPAAPPAPEGVVGEVAYAVVAEPDGRFGYRLERDGLVVGGATGRRNEAEATADARRDAARVAR